MSDVRGYGRYLGMVGGASRLLTDPGIYPVDNAAVILNDWTWQPGPPARVQIPYAWLSSTTPLRSRPDKPLTTASVSTESATARARDATSLAAFGNNRFTAALDTPMPEDAANLADWVVAYYATPAGDVPRARFPALTLRLNGRTVPEMQRILGVKIGQRIEITNPPATWPEGAAHQVVEGILHSAGEARDVVWNTAPVIGTAPGVAGPWFRLDVSAVNGTDLVPF